MRKIIPLIIVIFSIGGMAQEMTVIYTKKMHFPIYNNVDDYFQTGDVNTNNKIELDHQYVLRIDGKHSIYYPLKEINNDKIVNEYITDKRKISYESINNHPYSIIYKDVAEKSKVSLNHTFVVGEPKDILISEKLIKFDWMLTNETKEINGFLCKKATLTEFDNMFSKKSECVAWYAEDIPVHDGPERYWGLPGLVLEIIYDSGLNIVADKIIYDIDDFVVSPPSEGEKMTREEFENIGMMEFNKN